LSRSLTKISELDGTQAFCLPPWDSIRCHSPPWTQPTHTLASPGELVKRQVSGPCQLGLCRGALGFAFGTGTWKFLRQLDVITSARHFGGKKIAWDFETRCVSLSLLRLPISVS
jgi:hypothetical protein